MTAFDELFEERAGIIAETCKVDQDTGTRMAKQQLGLDEPVDVKEAVDRLAQRY